MRKYLSFLIIVLSSMILLSGCLQNEKTFDPDNNAPMINFFDLFPQTVVRYNTVTITVNYTDYDDDNVVFTIEPYEFPADYVDYDPDWEENTPDIVSGTDNTQFTWCAPHIAGRYWFKAKGTDGHFTTESLFSIIVLSRPPSITVSPAPVSAFKLESEFVKMPTFSLHIADADEPPASTVTATIQLLDLTGADTFPKGKLYFSGTDDTDLVTIATSETSATVIVDTGTATIDLHCGYYMSDADIALWNADRYDTFLVKVFLIDECGYSNSYSKQIIIGRTIY